MIKIILLAFFISLIIGYLIGLLSTISSGKIFGSITHKLFGWHVPNNNIEYHGINTVSRCKYCGKKIIKCHLDWFSEDDVC